MLTPAERLPVTDEILERRKMKTLEMPSLKDCLEANDATPYPYNKTFAQAREEPFVCLHTSGSTGMPKPVILKHGTVTHQDLFLHLSQLGGSTLNLARTSGTRMLFGLPLFHSAGICFLGYAIYSNTTVVFAPSYSVTAEEANAIHISGTVQGSFLGPNVLIDLARKPEYLENLRHLSYLTFGGAALPRAIGDHIKSRTHLFVSFGATETGFYPLEATEPDDWEYAAFSPVMGAELRPIGSGLFEFHFVRRSRLRDHQGVFATFPDRDEYTPKDLYSKHPRKEGLWLYEGRSDDVVVFAHGHKFNPTAMEGSLAGHPAVSAVLVCSNGQKWASLLVEACNPPGSDEERRALLDALWPHIERANADAPAYARITRELVLFTRDDRPMVRAGKGSVLRQRTAELYKEDLYLAYARLSANKPLDLFY